MTKYSVEKLYEIWNDGSGLKIEVGPDRDNLGFVEIRYVENKKVLDRIVMPLEMAKLVANAILSAVSDMEEQPK